MPLILLLSALTGGALYLVVSRPKERLDLFTDSLPEPEAPVEPAGAPTVSSATTRRFLNPLADAPYRVTSPYGPRTNPVTGQFQSLHNGLDLGAPQGTPIHAADGGRVVKIWLNDPVNGNAVKIWHPDGWATAYLHMVEPPSVVMGQAVARGQRIGLVGMTGRSTGPHLHFITYTPSGGTTDPRPITDPSPWTPARGTTTATLV